MTPPLTMKATAAASFMPTRLTKAVRAAAAFVLGGSIGDSSSPDDGGGGIVSLVVSAASSVLLLYPQLIACSVANALGIHVHGA